MHASSTQASFPLKYHLSYKPNRQEFSDFVHDFCYHYNRHETCEKCEETWKVCKIGQKDQKRAEKNNKLCKFDLQQPDFGLNLKILIPVTRCQTVSLFGADHSTHPNSSWPATWVSYYLVLLWLLQVEVSLRVLWGYFAVTACAVASQPFVTVMSKYPHSTLKGTATCSSLNSTL